SIAATETSMLETVLQYGTGKAAAIGQFAAGKTGTTSNYGDAWFVGWDSKYTVAIWVGFPDKLIPMTTDFNGTPVLGGTFPALIWHDFMTSAISIDKARAERAAQPKGSKAESESTGSPSSSESEAPASSQGPTTSTHSGPGSAGKESEKQSSPNTEAGSEGATPEKAAAPTPTPAHETSPTPAAPTAPSTPASPSPTGGVSPNG
ncbi:MAG: hypothetical protein ACYDHN_12180, partial [Solirubrobacteraceae bacterium]